MGHGDDVGSRQETVVGEVGDVGGHHTGVQRLCVLHKNVPGMLANITSLFGRDGVNVENLSNKSRGDYAYTMVDLGSKVGDNVIEDVRRTANVIRVRSLEW